MSPIFGAQVSFSSRDPVNAQQVIAVEQQHASKVKFALNLEGKSENVSEAIHHYSDGTDNCCDYLNHCSHGCCGLPSSFFEIPSFQQIQLGAVLSYSHISYIPILDNPPPRYS